MWVIFSRVCEIAMGGSTALESAHPICKTSSLIGERQDAFDDQVRLLNFSGQILVDDDLCAF